MPPSSENKPYRILNTRQVREAARDLSKKYGTPEDVFKGYVALEKSGDLHIASRELVESDLSGLNVKSFGLRVTRNKKPTIHAVQLLFTKAPMKELTKEEAVKLILERKKDGGQTVLSYLCHPLFTTSKQ